MGVNAVDSKELVKNGHLEAFVQVANRPLAASKMDRKSADLLLYPQIVAELCSYYVLLVCVFEFEFMEYSKAAVWLGKSGPDGL